MQRTVAASDFHDHFNFMHQILDIKPEIYISLGDYDTDYTISEAEELEAILKERGTRIIKVAGNHDINLYKKNWINSISVTDESLQLNKKSINFLGSFVSEYYKEMDFFGFKTLIVHGGLDGDLTDSPSVTGKERFLWYRLEDNDAISKNFIAMQKKGYNLMIRGHDHTPRYISLNEKIVVNPGWSGQKYLLDKKKVQVIDTGSVDNGFVCLIENQEVRFINIK